jgi:hypothetical protein
MTASARMVFDELKAVPGSSGLPDRKDVDVYRFTLNDESFLVLIQLLAHWRRNGRRMDIPGMRSLVDLVEHSPFPQKAAKAQYARWLIRYAKIDGVLLLCPRCATVLEANDEWGTCDACGVAHYLVDNREIPVVRSSDALETVLATLDGYDAVLTQE